MTRTDPIETRRMDIEAKQKRNDEFVKTNRSIALEMLIRAALASKWNQQWNSPMNISSRHWRKWKNFISVECFKSISGYVRIQTGRLDTIKVKLIDFPISHYEQKSIVFVREQSAISYTLRPFPTEECHSVIEWYSSAISNEIRANLGEVAQKVRDDEGSPKPLELLATRK